MKMEDYDEQEVLKRYVLTHYSTLFTRLESLGFKAVATEEKAKVASERMARILRDKWGAENDAGVVEALSKGEEGFKNAVFHRLMKEHSSEIFINRCPKCSKIVKTPRAKQCPWCYHDWH